eukprot:TRINITY_DN19591_c0_g1_i1.p2 TRINITY_DN19591_c0_g1~~TRINITY_DN19591_c0_g1_i1.p2  ORF type:complete len:147 (-),score=19.35 TRINITY_DN19591_c0_g1_i1:10-450(-)
MPVPTRRPKILKKRNKPFTRFQSDTHVKVKPAWRHPRGMDSRIRRRFRGNKPMARIGYGSDKRTKHMLPNNFYRFVVHNVAELELLLMHNHKYAAQIAHDVSFQTRKAIIDRAGALDIKVLNPNACLLYTSPSPRDLSTSRMPSSA